MLLVCIYGEDVSKMAGNETCQTRGYDCKIPWVSEFEKWRGPEVEFPIWCIVIPLGGIGCSSSFSEVNT